MRYNKEILKSTLFKVTSLNSISVLLKIGIGLITSKIIAVFVGPNGMALVGNLRNFLSSIETVATLGFQNGTVKYIAENKADNEALKKIISTVFITLVFTALAISLLLFFGADYWNTRLFGSSFQYKAIFKVLALALPWYIVNVLLVSIINGLGQFKRVIYIAIFGNLIGLLLSVVLISQFRTFGALLSVVLTPSLLFFVSFYYINKEYAFLKNITYRSFDSGVIRLMSSYTLMTLVSGFAGPLVYLAIRNNVIETIGIKEAGYWEAISRISSYYLMFIGTLLSVYFLPKLVEAQNNTETKKVFWSYYKTIMPLFGLGLLLVYGLKDFLITLLFTADFKPVSELFFWQLAGDFFKGASLILGMQFFAKKLTRDFIITEITSLLILYVASIYCINAFGVKGVVIGHTITYFVYLCVLGVYFRKALFAR